MIKKVSYIYKLIKQTYIKKKILTSFNNVDLSITVDDKTKIIVKHNIVKHSHINQILEDVDKDKINNNVNAYVIIAYTDENFNGSNIYFFDNDRVFVSFVLIDTFEKKVYMYDKIISPIRCRLKKDLLIIKKLLNDNMQLL